MAPPACACQQPPVWRAIPAVCVPEIYAALVAQLEISSAGLLRRKLSAKHQPGFVHAACPARFPDEPLHYPLGGSGYGMPIYKVLAHKLLAAAWGITAPSDGTIIFIDADPTHLCSDNLLGVPYTDKHIRRARLTHAETQARNALIRAAYEPDRSAASQQQLRARFHLKRGSIYRIVRDLLLEPAVRDQHVRAAMNYRTHNYQEVALHFGLSTARVRRLTQGLATQSWQELRCTVRAAYEPSKPTHSNAVLAQRYQLHPHTIARWCKDLRRAYVQSHQELVTAKRHADWRAVKRQQWLINGSAQTKRHA